MAQFGASPIAQPAATGGGHVRSRLWNGGDPTPKPPTPAPKPTHQHPGEGGGSAGGGSGGGTTGGGGGSVNPPTPPPAIDWGAQFAALMNNFGGTDSQLVGALLSQQNAQASLNASGYAPIFTPPAGLLNSLFIAGWPTSGNAS